MPVSLSDYLRQLLADQEQNGGVPYSAQQGAVMPTPAAGTGVTLRDETGEYSDYAGSNTPAPNAQPRLDFNFDAPPAPVPTPTAPPPPPQFELGVKPPSFQLGGQVPDYNVLLQQQLAKLQAGAEEAQRRANNPLSSILLAFQGRDLDVEAQKAQEQLFTAQGQMSDRMMRQQEMEDRRQEKVHNALINAGKLSIEYGQLAPAEQERQRGRYINLAGTVLRSGGITGFEQYVTELYAPGNENYREQFSRILADPAIPNSRREAYIEAGMEYKTAKERVEYFKSVIKEEETYAKTDLANDLPNLLAEARQLISQERVAKGGKPLGADEWVDEREVVDVIRRNYAELADSPIVQRAWSALENDKNWGEKLSTAYVRPGSVNLKRAEKLAEEEAKRAAEPDVEYKVSDGVVWEIPKGGKPRQIAVASKPINTEQSITAIQRAQAQAQRYAQFQFQGGLMGTPQNLEKIGATPLEINAALAYIQDQEYRRLMEQAGLTVTTPPMQMPESFMKKLEEAQGRETDPNVKSVFRRAIDALGGGLTGGVTNPPGKQPPPSPPTTGAQTPTANRPPAKPTKEAALAEIKRLMDAGMSKDGALTAMKAAGWDVK